MARSDVFCGVVCAAALWMSVEKQEVKLYSITQIENVFLVSIMNKDSDMLLS